MQNKEETVKTLLMTIEAVRNAQLFMQKLEQVTKAIWLEWNCETYNVLDFLNAWVKAMED